jgi:glycosyltransferase involved in cell wall biosynthesis
VTHVSIIVCTNNRAPFLNKTLSALCAVTVPEGFTAELLVVDNASTDSTADVIKQFRCPNIPVTYLYEPIPGKCRSLNRAVQASTGHILMFADDDVCAPENWIEGMCSPIVAGNADIVAGGVRLAPELVQPWFRPIDRDWLASTEGVDRENPSAMGANMAISRRVFARVPMFDVDLGPGVTGAGEETLIVGQAKAAGFRVAQRFDVEVEHHFDVSRLTRKSYLTMADRYGQTRAYLLYHWEQQPIRFPALRMAYFATKLALYRATRRRNASDTAPAPEWEMQNLVFFHTYRHYLKLMKQPRKYTKHGLVKIA